MYTVSDVLLMFLKSFVVGGLICTIAQLLINYTKITSGKILVYFMLTGLFLGALGVYDYLIDFAGAGASVPISGFGYLLAKGAMKGAKYDFFKTVTGGVTASSAGITSAIVFGYLFSVVFRSKTKKN